MAQASLAKEIVAQVERLPLEQQRQVLDFARALAATQPRGVPGHTLLGFAGAIPAEDLAAMWEAIEAGCGQSGRDEQSAGDSPSLRSLYGLWADRGPAPSADEIDQARREAWTGSPRHDVH